MKNKAKERNQEGKGTRHVKVNMSGFVGGGFNVRGGVRSESHGGEKGKKKVSEKTADGENILRG